MTASSHGSRYRSRRALRIRARVRHRSRGCPQSGSSDIRDTDSCSSAPCDGGWPTHAASEHASSGDSAAALPSLRVRHPNTSASAEPTRRQPVSANSAWSRSPSRHRGRRSHSRGYLLPRQHCHDTTRAVVATGLHRSLQTARCRHAPPATPGSTSGTASVPTGTTASAVGCPSAPTHHVLLPRTYSEHMLKRRAAARPSPPTAPLQDRRTRSTAQAARLTFARAERRTSLPLLRGGLPQPPLPPPRIPV